jgi:uncharacterized protein
MWLVVGGPATVVVAAIATAVIAIRGADTLVPMDAPATATTTAGPTPLTPAVQARNHAATPQR